MFSGCLNPNTLSRHCICWNEEAHYAQCYQDPWKPPCWFSCRHILFSWWNFCACLPRNRVWPAYWTIHSVDVTSNYVGHACSHSNSFQNFWCQKHLCYSETNHYQDLGEWLCMQIVPQIWFPVFDGRTCPYVWCLEWTCPRPKFLMLNIKLFNILT